MADTKAFEVDSNGILIEDGPHITGGSATPVYNALVPTLYIQSNGALWTNPGGTTWTALGSSSGSNNFAYYHIASGIFVTIESGQAMVTSHLGLLGCLKIDGCMRLT